MLLPTPRPTLFPYTTLFRSKAATSDLRNAIAAAKTCYTDHDAYIYTGGACDDATLGPIEPSLNFVATGVASANEIGRAHVGTPVTPIARMPSSAAKKKLSAT